MNCPSICLDGMQICCEFSVGNSRPEFSLYHVFPQKRKPLPLPVLYTETTSFMLNQSAAIPAEFHHLQTKFTKTDTNTLKTIQYCAFMMQITDVSSLGEILWTQHNSPVTVCLQHISNPQKRREIKLKGKRKKHTKQDLKKGSRGHVDSGGLKMALISNRVSQATTQR